MAGEVPGACHVSVLNLERASWEGVCMHITVFEPETGMWYSLDWQQSMLHAPSEVCCHHADMHAVCY